MALLLQVCLSFRGFATGFLIIAQLPCQSFTQGPNNGDQRRPPSNESWLKERTTQRGWPLAAQKVSQYATKETSLRVMFRLRLRIANPARCSPPSPRVTPFPNMTFTFFRHGYGSKFNHQGTAGFSLCFHLPRILGFQKG